jgi:hypothetical protein
MRPLRDNGFPAGDISVCNHPLVIPLPRGLDTQESSIILYDLLLAGSKQQRNDYSFA